MYDLTVEIYCDNTKHYQQYDDSQQPKNFYSQQDKVNCVPPLEGNCIYM